jgi:hypothetical protein
MDEQKELEQQFIEFCTNSNFLGIKKLVEETLSELTKRKSNFYFFKKLFIPEKPILNFFANKSEGLIALSKKGDLQILSYLHSLPLFVEQLMDKNNHNIPHYFDAFTYAGANGHIKCAELFSPHINNYDNYQLSVYHGFNDACRSGDLNTVKFLANTPLLGMNALYMINTKYNEFQPHAHAFITACESGKLNIVEYLTSDPNLKEKINLDWIEDPIHIEDQRVIEHFIIDLDLPDNHPFLQKIINDDHDLVDNLIRRREEFKDLSASMTHNPPSLKKVKKI